MTILGAPPRPRRSRLFISNSESDSAALHFFLPPLRCISISFSSVSFSSILVLLRVAGLERRGFFSIIVIILSQGILTKFHQSSM